MKPTIKFKPAHGNSIDPWKTATAAKSYSDELLLPEFADRQLHLKEGPNWMRIVPAMEESSADWMLGLHALATPTGKFAHPRTYEPAARSVWDTMYGHLRQTEPGKLYSKANPDGLRLLPNPMTLCWVITGHGADDGTEPAVRLLMLSGYSGERGGSPGLGHQILQMASDLDENRDLAHDIAGAEGGVQVCIEKVVSKESKYPRYILRAGRQPAPIEELIASLPVSEAAVLRPLENVVRRMTEEEQWERLLRLMPATEVDSLREAIEQ